MSNNSKTPRFVEAFVAPLSPDNQVEERNAAMDALDAEGYTFCGDMGHVGALFARPNRALRRSSDRVLWLEAAAQFLSDWGDCEPEELVADASNLNK